MQLFDELKVVFIATIKGVTIRQNRKKIGISILILILLIALGIIVLSTIHPNLPTKPSNKTFNVAGDGSGDFNCDGIDDQIEINQALAYVAENPQSTTCLLYTSPSPRDRTR